MELETVSLPERNKIMQAYNNDEKFIHTYFDYKNEKESFPKRLTELSERSFKRPELAEIIRLYMEPFGLSLAAKEHINELATDAVTVVGGQQAGILTGPLYSVHKAISVILLAKKQRAALGVPVVPVFWVAGEDHDLNEINHVHTVSGRRISKIQYRQKFVLKLMASDASYVQNEMASFVKEIFGSYGETAYTKDLLNEVLEAVEKENTFTGFFVRLMNGLFMDEGLLFIDSAYSPLRELEKEYFIHMIKESQSIAQMVYDKEQQFVREGFGSPIDAQIETAHLFYIHETGRVLLAREKGFFTNDSTRVQLSEEEMLEIAENQPQLLSNNVVTRPIMQDLVFPVLAFVGGPGEIAYWALLKEAFHHLKIKMPILVPRMSLTLITPRAKQALESTSFSIEKVMAGKIPAAKEELTEQLRDPQLHTAIMQIEDVLKDQYGKLEELIEAQGLKLPELLQKNLEFHSSQIDYLNRKAEEAFLQKHDTLLRKYDDMENELFPEAALQERIFTPYTFLNLYGPTLIKELLRLPYEMDGKHNLIYL